MKILILDGSPGTVKLPEDRFTGVEIDHITIIGKKTKRCTGCFSCFFNTPGHCALNDWVSELPRKYISSDIFLLICPVTFGGYSSEVSNVFSRLIIQLVLHLFERKGGEIRRQKRYDQPYPAFIALGCGTPSERAKETFRELTARNAYHLHTKDYANFFSDEANYLTEIQNFVEKRRL